MQQEEISVVIDKLNQLQSEVAVIKARMGERLWTTEQVAREFSVSKRTVRRRVADGLITPIDGPGHPRFTAAEVARCKRENVFAQRHRNYAS